MENHFSHGGRISESKFIKLFFFKQNFKIIILIIFFPSQQRAQKIFKASTPMDLSVVRTKLMGFGMQVLDGIDPNPDNFVLAGIIHTRMAQIGCLLRLEPNKAAQVKKFETLKFLDV